MPSSIFGKADYIYPTFIVTRLPHGISGLLIARYRGCHVEPERGAEFPLFKLDDGFLPPPPSETTIAHSFAFAHLDISFRAVVGLAVLSLHKVARHRSWLTIALSPTVPVRVFLLGVLTAGATRTAQWSECFSASASNSTCGWGRRSLGRGMSPSVRS
jgi:hypothetical protein